MRGLDKYIVYSSIIALFSENFGFHYIIDLKIFYIIILVNFVLLASKTKLVIHRNIIILLSFFIIHGIVFYLVFQNPLKSLFAQIIGISISSIYYYNFLKYYKTKYAFDIYLKVALIVAIIAIPMFYFNINVFNNDRLNGIMTEPAHYAAIMLPAIYAFLRKKKYLKFAIILITVLLSKSSVGYLGLLLILLLPLLKERYLIKYSLPVFLIIGLSAFYLSTQWNKPINENESNVLVRRLKETGESMNSIFNGKFEKFTNLSSYAFLSNAFIARNIFYEKPLGTGLGSYQYEYAKYYPLLEPPKYLIAQKQSEINKTDANSLALRMLGDLGIFAFLILIYFFYRSYIFFKNDNKVVSQSAFYYLIIKLIREGHYFPPEFYFFLIIFLKEFNEDITHS